MATTQKGTDFELRVYDFVSKALQAGELAANPKLSKAFHQKKYYSRDREGLIAVDVSVESYISGCSEWSTLWIFECKDYTGSVPVNDVEELHCKKNQIAPDNAKVYLVTTARLQQAAFKFAKNNGIGVIRLFPARKVKYVLPFGEKSNIARVFTTINALTNPNFTDPSKEFYAVDGDFVYDDLLSLLKAKQEQKNKIPKNYSHILPRYKKELTPYTKDEKKLENPILYKHIQHAYEFIREREKEIKISSDIVARLYTLPLSSVFRSSGEGDFDRLRESEVEPIERREIGTSEGCFLINTGYVDSFTAKEEVNSLSEQEQGHFTSLYDEDKSNKIPQLGSEAFASYLPIHFFFNGGQFSTDWGIYISEEGIGKVAFALKRRCKELFGETDEQEHENSIFTKIAYQILLRHELYHFKIEFFTLNTELLVNKSLYEEYIINVYSKTQNSDKCLEEAFANASILNSRVIQSLFTTLYNPSNETRKGKLVAWRSAITKEFFDFQPPGYSNYNLSKGWSENFDSSTGFKHRQRAMNFLCNQIISGQVDLTEQSVPFYAFPPENYFLRAENLVPINIVKTADVSKQIIRFEDPAKKKRSKNKKDNVKDEKVN